MPILKTILLLILGLSNIGNLQEVKQEPIINNFCKTDCNIELGLYYKIFENENYGLSFLEMEQLIENHKECYRNCIISNELIKN